MLPQKNKLDKKLFNKVFKSGKTYHSNFLYAKIFKLPTKEESRFAIVVPVKGSKKAIERNKLKRQGYNIIKKYLIQIEKEFAIIFFLKKEFPKNEFSKYENEIVYLLKQAKLFKK